MDITTQDRANYQYRDVIPKRFRNNSGVATYDFKVRTPSSRPYRFAELADGSVREFDSSALCRIVYDGKLTPMLVRQCKTLNLYEAILLVGQLLAESKRVQKYITTHKAYECLEPRRDHTLSAVRHSITHAAVSYTHLTLPTTPYV